MIRITNLDLLRDMNLFIYTTKTYIEVQFQLTLKKKKNFFENLNK